MSDLIIGIDLGTTNSLIAYRDQAGPRIIASPEGLTSLPSVVHLDSRTGALEIGASARARAVERPMETIYSVKRLMGRSLAEVSGEVPFVPYRIVAHMPDNVAANASLVASPAGIAAVQVGPFRLTPQEVSAAILRELKRWAEAHFHQIITRAVVTVPAYFDDAQRQATRDAARIAGLEVIRIVNEPTAAALAYGLDRAEDSTIAVYDFGGGTFDVSILRIEKGVFRVLATRGNTHLGGDDMDRQLMLLLQADIRKQFGTELDFDPSTQQALRNFAEALKIKLSEATTATVEIDLGHGRLYHATVTREQYENLIAEIIGQTLDCCATALMDAQMAPGGVERVVMVGGATFIPAVRRAVGRFFNAEVYTALDPMQTVALGAAVQASILAGKKRDALLLDIVPLSLGIETMGGAVTKLIAQGSPIPCHAGTLFTTFIDGQTSVKVHVLQGERELVKDCRSLGQFILTGLPPMPAGIPRIAISLLVDASGILNVSAKEERSGVSASIQVIPSHGLTQKEVTRMIREGLAHHADDLLDHWLIDLHNQIRVDSAAIEEALANVGDQVEAAYQQELTGLIEGLRQMLDWNDTEKIARALHFMNQKSTHLAELAIAKSLREA